MSGSNICYFVPKRWRIAVFAIVLLLVAYFFLEPMIKPGSPINFGCEYEMTDVLVTPESLGVSFCPICFGRNESICEGVLYSTVRLRRKKRASLEDKWKPKALGLLNKDRISIKHLGNISEFHKLDNELCSLVGTINAPCGNDVIWKSFVNPSSIERSSEYNSKKNMAASLDERIAEAVRRFPVLYDKSCKDFKDNNKKMNAWEDVAKIAGLPSGEEAKTYFTNLRTRYTRDRKKLKQVKVSGTGSEDVSKVTDEIEDMFFYLAWLDPFYKPRKTSSNFITIDSGNEGSEDDDTQNVDGKSNMTETTSSDADNHAANNFRPTRTPKLQMKRKSAGRNQDVANAEVQVLQSIGEKLGQKKTPYFKDEDELFGAWIASQMRQIAPERKVVAKMQISNIVYQEMLALFNSMPLSYTGGQGSWKYPQQQMPELHQPQQHQPQQQQHQQHHSFQDTVVRNQSQKPFQFPNLLEPLEVPLMRPGQLFYQNKSQTGFDFEQGS